MKLLGDRIPRKILFAIAGKIRTYENGLVSPELASALSTAPDQNMRVRLEWQDDEETFRHDRLVRDYEFRARGSFLPGDAVMAKVEPGCWSRSAVLLVGMAMLVVVVE